MARKKKLNEHTGIIGLVPLLPVGGVIGTRTRKDNFEFKGLPSKIWSDQQQNEVVIREEADRNRMLALIEEKGNVVYKGSRLQVERVYADAIATKNGTIKLNKIQSYEVSPTSVKLNEKALTEGVTKCELKRTNARLTELRQKYEDSFLLEEIWRGLEEGQTEEVYEFIKSIWEAAKK